MTKERSFNYFISNQVGVAERCFLAELSHSSSADRQFYVSIDSKLYFAIRKDFHLKTSTDNFCSNTFCMKTWPIIVSTLH